MIDISDKILSIDPFYDPFARRLEWKLRKYLVFVQSKRQTVMLDLFNIIESLGQSFTNQIRDPLSEYVNASQLRRRLLRKYRVLLARRLLDHPRNALSDTLNPLCLI